MSQNPMAVTLNKSKGKGSLWQHIYSSWNDTEKGKAKQRRKAFNVSEVFYSKFKIIKPFYIAFI